MDGSSTESETCMNGSRGRRCAARLLTETVSLCVIVVVAACAMPQRTFQPEREPASLDDVSFLHYLATVPVVTVHEGMRAVLLLTDDSDKGTTFERRYEVLHGRGAVKLSWRLKPGRILSKGTLAYMLRTICRLPRGFNEALSSSTGFGDRRYALKTCIDEGLIPYGLSHEPVTGGELLSALTNAERYLESRERNIP